MNKIIAACLVPLALSGCPGFTMGIQTAGQQIPGVVGQLDDTVYAIAIAKYQAAQRFLAQINGTMPVMPPLPAPTPAPSPAPMPSPAPQPTPTPTPAPMPSPTPAPGGTPATLP